jgi:predicted amino acid racemase
LKSGTYLEIDLKKLEENSRRIVEKCRPAGIQVLGVTKGFSALPRIVSAMVRGGIDSLADSRLENIIPLRKKGFANNITLLRLPKLSAADRVIMFADYSVNSEYAVLSRLAEVARARGITHKIILMVDVGDLREGVLPEEALALSKEIMLLKGITISGIGTNMGCYGGILPSVHNLNLLLEVRKEIEEKAGLPLEIVSGGGTSSLKLVDDGEMPEGINQLRVGEAILLGTDTTHNYKIPGLHQDAFLLRTEVIEMKVKPSIPIGTAGRDAFGKSPVFIDKGHRKRAIASIGKQDVNIEGLIPVNENIYVLGASSDHLIVDITDAGEEIAVGDQLVFKLSYSGLLSTCTSKYVKGIYKKQ